MAADPQDTGYKFQGDERLASLRRTASIQGAASLLKERDGPLAATASKKRKRGQEDDVKVKRGCSERTLETPRPLHNYAQSCYQNSILHILNAVPELARLQTPILAKDDPTVPWSQRTVQAAASGFRAAQQAIEDLLDGKCGDM